MLLQKNVRALLNKYVLIIILFSICKLTPLEETRLTQAIEFQRENKQCCKIY